MSIEADVRSERGPGTDENGNLTPFRRQYFQLKRRFPDTVLLFRIGDFYECFDDDAKLVSAELDIVLTGRDASKGQRIPMAGVPHHALDGYLAKLIRKGYRVAICDQLSDPKTSKGLVERDVTRVVTPGTVVEPSMLDEKRNNYLVAITVDLTRGVARIGLAFADVSTGEFAVTQLAADDATVLDRELERLAPSEVLLASDGPGAEIALPPAVAAARITRLDAWKLDPANARDALCRHFEVATLDGFGCADQPAAIRAAGALVQYLWETRRGALAQIGELRTYQTSDFMLLDAATRRNLELIENARGGGSRGSLVWVLDRTRTPGGARLLRAWLGQPLTDLTKIGERLDAVEELVSDTAARVQLRDLLGQVRDLERLMNRVGQGIATPRDLIALRTSLLTIPAIRETLEPGAGVPGPRPHPDPLPEGDGAREGILASEDGGGPQSHRWPRRREIAGALDPGTEIADLIEQAIVSEPPATLVDGGVIAPGFSADLDDLRASTEHARQWIEGLEATERQRTGIRGLKVGYNKVFGYYLEISNANRDLVPNGYVRKQTLVGAERYVTSELKEYEAIVLNAKERIVESEQALFRQLCAQIAAERERVLRTARALARADVLATLAEVAVQNRYVRPAVDDGPVLEIRGGRHPVVEQSRTDVPFTPNDVYLSTDDAQVVILTGPNMAGKSTYLRQAALIVLLAQVGSFVPADAARVGVVDRIFTRVGAQDDLSAGQSTFLVEMLETANLLTQGTKRSLLILDEVGRGTSTYDGLAIAQAIVEYVHNHPRLGARTLFATHYHELTELATVLPRIRNFRMDVREENEEVHFLHRVVPGGADRSYGVHVARLAGVPRAVTRRAEEILRELERHNPRGRKPARDAPRVQVVQLSLLAEPNPAMEDLKSLDVLSLTPIEAISKLFELQQKARTAEEQH